MVAGRKTGTKVEERVFPIRLPQEERLVAAIKRKGARGRRKPSRTKGPGKTLS